jgi:murein DD-endopeptidase MepM/ murein hydrolase activator NlpD
LASICSRVSGGRVLLRPEGSPIIAGEVADQEDHLVPQVLQLAHLVEHHGVADVDVGRGGVQPELDAQRLAGGLGLGQPASVIGCTQSASRQQLLARRALSDTAEGVSKRRAFLASPMEFSRVTSGFALRFHPILKSWRRHLGVDYAAPVGTPVRSVGEGVVDFAGWQNGYGKVVQIQHGKERSTLYAHLSRIDVRKGQRVAQGDHVGAVGMTGWTTGPHLHFEFRVNGQHRDPLVMAKSAETVALDESARPRFEEFARTYQAKLEIAESMVGTRASFE